MRARGDLDVAAVGRGRVLLSTCEISMCYVTSDMSDVSAYL